MKLTRVASGSSRQHSTASRGERGVGRLVVRPRSAAPPIRNCSCVTGKYQQTSTQDDFASSAILALRSVGDEGQLGCVVQEAPKDRRAIGGPAVGAHRRHLQEPRGRRAAIQVNRQDQ